MSYQDQRESQNESGDEPHQRWNPHQNIPNHDDQINQNSQNFGLAFNPFLQNNSNLLDSRISNHGEQNQSMNESNITILYQQPQQDRSQIEESLLENNNRMEEENFRNRISMPGISFFQTNFNSSSFGFPSHISDSSFVARHNEYGHLQFEENINRIQQIYQTVLNEEAKNIMINASKNYIDCPLIQLNADEFYQKTISKQMENFFYEISMTTESKGFQFNQATIKVLSNIIPNTNPQELVEFTDNVCAIVKSILVNEYDAQIIIDKSVVENLFVRYLYGETDILQYLSIITILTNEFDSVYIQNKYEQNVGQRMLNLEIVRNTKEKQFYDDQLSLLDEISSKIFEGFHVEFEQILTRVQKKLNNLKKEFEELFDHFQSIESTKDEFYEIQSLIVLKKLQLNVDQKEELLLEFKKNLKLLVENKILRFYNKLEKQSIEKFKQEQIEKEKRIIINIQKIEVVQNLRILFSQTRQFLEYLRCGFSESYFIIFNKDAQQQLQQYISTLLNLESVEESFNNDFMTLVLEVIIGSMIQKNQNIGNSNLTLEQYYRFFDFNNSEEVNCWLFFGLSQAIKLVEQLAQKQERIRELFSKFLNSEFDLVRCNVQFVHVIKQQMQSNSIEKRTIVFELNQRQQIEKIHINIDEFRIKTAYALKHFNLESIGLLFTLSEAKDKAALFAIFLQQRQFEQDINSQFISFSNYSIDLLQIFKEQMGNYLEEWIEQDYSNPAEQCNITDLEKCKKTIVATGKVLLILEGSRFVGVLTVVKKSARVIQFFEQSEEIWKGLGKTSYQLCSNNCFFKSFFQYLIQRMKFSSNALNELSNFFEKQKNIEFNWDFLKNWLEISTFNVKENKKKLEEEFKNQEKLLDKEDREFLEKKDKQFLQQQKEDKKNFIEKQRLELMAFEQNQKLELANHQKEQEDIKKQTAQKKALRLSLFQKMFSKPIIYARNMITEAINSGINRTQNNNITENQNSLNQTQQIDKYKRISFKQYIAISNYNSLCCQSVFKKVGEIQMQNKENWKSQIEKDFIHGNHESDPVLIILKYKLGQNQFALRVQKKFYFAYFSAENQVAEQNHQEFLGNFHNGFFSQIELHQDLVSQFFRLSYDILWVISQEGDAINPKNKFILNLEKRAQFLRSHFKEMKQSP